MKNNLFSLVIIFVSLFAFGDLSSDQVVKGEFVSIRIEPKGKTLRLYLTGYEAAEMNLKDFNLKVEFKDPTKDENSIISPELKADFFELVKPNSDDFKIHVKSKKVKETLSIKLKPKH